MLEIIITSSLLILIIIVLRFALRGRLSQKAIYALWLIAAVRLLVPMSIADTRISVMNLFERRESTQQQKTVPVDQYIAIDTYINYTDSKQEIENNQQNIMQPLQGQDTISAAELKEKMQTEDILTLIWAAGVTAVLIYIVVSNVKFYNYLKNNRVPFECEGSSLPVYVAKGIDSPCLFGILWPAIYLNEFAAADKQRVKYIVVHEQMHYRHCDHIWAVVRVLCVSFYWFNPLVWLAAHLSRQDCELACDSAAIRAIGNDHRYEYGRTLIDMISTRFRFSSSILTSTAMTSGAKTIKRRILMLKMTHKNAIWAAAAAVVILLVAAGCTFTGAISQEEKAAETDMISQTDVEYEMVSQTDAKSDMVSPTTPENNADSYEFPDELSDFRGAVNSEDPMRLSNLQLAMSLINGTVILPNEEFSFNEAVGERTAERGFKEAAYRPYENTSEKYGSGIAQVATALYNAAFEAQLNIVEHHNNEYAVDYNTRDDYMFGNDASVVWGQRDLRFINSTGHPIQLCLEIAGESVGAQIYGVSNGMHAMKYIREGEETEEAETINYKIVFRRKTEGAADVVGRNGCVKYVYRLICPIGEENYWDYFTNNSELVNTATYLPQNQIIYTDELPSGCEYDREYQRGELEAIIRGNKEQNRKKLDLSNMSLEEISNHPDLQYLIADVPMFEKGSFRHAEHYIAGEDGAEIDMLRLEFDATAPKSVRAYIDELLAGKFPHISTGQGELNREYVYNSVPLFVTYSQAAYGVGVQFEMFDSSSVVITFFEQGDNMFGYDPVFKG